LGPIDAEALLGCMIDCLCCTTDFLCRPRSSTKFIRNIYIGYGGDELAYYYTEVFSQLWICPIFCISL